MSATTNPIVANPNGNVTAVTNPVTRVITFTDDSALSGSGLSGFDPAASLKKILTGTSWLWKNSATTGVNSGTWWLHVPVSDTGYYSSFAIGTFGVAGSTPHLGRMHVGLIGSCKHHAAGAGVTKTGTWTTSSLDYVSGGSAAYSITAGDQISFTTAGHTIVLRTVAISNGGYGVVSIDGDFTAANRLPVFTQADYDASLCRLVDIGRRYIQTGTAALTWPDYHIPLAEGLADTAHTVIIEATGTKPSYSSAARCYAAEIVGCSASDIGQSLAVGTRAVAQIEAISDPKGSAASAFLYTPEVETALTPGTFEFLGEIHAAATIVGSIVVDVDGVDRSGAAAGAYYSGNVIQIRVVSTVASTDATGTPVMNKATTHTFSAAGSCPLVTTEYIKWLVDKRVRAGYTMMLPIGNSRHSGSPALKNDRWENVQFGTYESVPSDFTANAGAQRGNVRATMVIASSDLHDKKAYATFLDGGAGVNSFALAGPHYVFMQDRSDGLDKVYFPRSSASNIERFLTGDSFQSVVGFGVAT